jgi:Na+/H+ antiporter NhaD/arsenite permease-like protein
MIYAVLRKLRRFFARETVLCLALAAAAISSFFVPPSMSYLEYVDWKVLSSLFCLMTVVQGLRVSGAFDILASSVLRFAGTTRSIAAILVATTFFASMGITNDVALITFIPFGLLLMKDCVSWRVKAHIVTLQTIAANVGSALTPVGNPQNLYLFSYYRFSPRDFFVGIYPVVIAGGALLAVSLFRIKPQTLVSRHNGPNYTLKPLSFAVFIALFAVSVLAVFRILDYRMVTAIVIITVLLIDRGLVVRVDYSLLVTFLGFFVFIGNIQRIPAVRELLTGITGINPMLVAALASQAISNVPAAILLSRFTDDAVGILRGVSLGGMGTIIASLASVISFKFFAHEHRDKSLAFMGIFTKWNLTFFVALFGIASFV